MADSRFFQKAGPFTLAELASLVDGELASYSDGSLLIDDVSPLETASEGHISFLDNKKYLDAFRKTKAAACIVDPKFADIAPQNTALILTSKPYKAYALIAQKIYPAVVGGASIHASAIIDPSAKIADDCHIGAGVVVGRNAEIGAGCHIGANTVIGDGVTIGSGTTVGSNASFEFCFIGNDCQIHAGVRIGNRGFGFAMEAEGYIDVPQLGRVLIGNGVEIGANSTVDRGAGPDTIIGDGSKIDNLVQIGHNAQIGKQCVIVGQAGIAGSSVLEDYVVLGAQCGVNGHIRLGTGVQVAGQSGVMRNVEPGQAVAGTPAMPIKDFFRLCTLWQKQLKTKKGNENE
ncbi:UDP-3-O-(3-hydroxymyristoyl)glucosamine N-acyltransferase [Kiloniella laminariae]|uniref:UDP-3-O-acylglucosamine N-acyltransferase n=1 Tax=Kiloniella laminariae TaxID=454162 RepID=A0ABT4LLR5_9PROT|nr:UDP-3-O-(3-hydroxymyristoyl)glucosamine N-acyltransferase [Kiloniella laminariae]MCZ4282032.1 UDP-3-O-(3-hydroxymyristoyl)glucosamine N-acyltransferase [Kiloniella laminariae]